MFSVISLTFFFIHSCQFAKGDEIKNVMLFPIDQTPYMMYLDKETRSHFSVSIDDNKFSFAGTEFWKNTEGLYFTKDNTKTVIIEGQTRNIKTKVGPVLPLHSRFCIRKTDSTDGKIRIQFNWRKDYLSAGDKERAYNYEYEIKLFNFKGIALGTFSIPKPADLSKPTVEKTTFVPLSNIQKYSEEKPSDACDMLNMLIRVKINDGEYSPWTHHGVHPEDKFEKEIKEQQDWSIEDIVKQHSAFIMLSQSLDKNDDNDLSVKIGWLTLFSQTAADSGFNDNKYLSTIIIPNDAMTINYTLKDVGQRSGAGFGLLSWSKNGHYLTEKFTKHFQSDGRINDQLLKSLIETCFSYGDILNADIGTGTPDSNKNSVWRNADRNNEWDYAIDKQELKARRTMLKDDVPETHTVGQVNQITWLFDSDTWKTNPDGSLSSHE